MEQKTLGEIARDTWLAGTGPLYVEWDRISDAIVAAHEARRWKPWPPCVDGGLPDVVALDDPKLGRKFGFLRDHKWVDEDGVEIIEYGVPPERWCAIPAPPKEAE